MFEQNPSTNCIFIIYKKIEKNQWINQVLKNALNEVLCRKMKYSSYN